MCIYAYAWTSDHLRLNNISVIISLKKIISLSCNSQQSLVYYCSYLGKGPCETFLSHIDMFTTLVFRQILFWQPYSWGFMDIDSLYPSKRCTVEADIYSSGSILRNCLQFPPNFSYRDCIIKCMDLEWTTYNHLSSVFWAVMSWHYSPSLKEKAYFWTYLFVGIKLNIRIQLEFSLLFSFILLSCIIYWPHFPLPPLLPFLPHLHLPDIFLLYFPSTTELFSRNTQ